MMRQREAEFAFIANDSQMNDDFFDEESQPNSEYAPTSERQMHGFLEYAAPLNREPDPNDFVYLLDDEEADPNCKLPANFGNNELYTASNMRAHTHHRDTYAGPWSIKTDPLGFHLDRQTSRAMAIASASGSTIDTSHLDNVMRTGHHMDRQTSRPMVSASGHRMAPSHRAMTSDSTANTSHMANTSHLTNTSHLANTSHLDNIINLVAERASWFSNLPQYECSAQKFPDQVHRNIPPCHIQESRMPESPILESQENECHDSKETKLHLHGVQQYEENQRSEFDECPDEEVPDEMHIQPQDAGYRSKGQSTVAFEYFDNGQIDFRNVASALGLYGPKKGPGPTTKSCEFCGLVVQHPSKIAAHMRTHTGEKPFLCEICGQEFSQRTPYRMHLKRHIGDLPFPCSFCPKKFPNNASRNGHEMRVHRERFPSESSHFKPISSRIVHPYAKPRSPETQNADQIYSSSTTRSIRSPIVHWQPPVGDIRPTSETAMRKITNVVEAVASGHKSVPAQKPPQPHFCRSQDNIYTVPSRPAPTVAQCAECGLVFKHPSKIQAHMRTHTGEKPFLCEQCGLACSTNSALRVHIKRFHTRERPHECTWECGMRFVSVAARNEHERIVHAGIKRYQCTVGDCRRLFTRRSYLMKHLSKDHPSQIGDNSQAIQNVDYSKLPHNYPAEANVSANVSYPDFENVESGHATNVSKFMDPSNICLSQSTAKMENVHEKGQESFDNADDFFVEDHGRVSYAEYSPDAAEFFAAMPSGYDQMTESESYSAHLQEPHHLPHLTQNFRYREDFQQEPFQYHFAGKHSNE